MTELTCWTLIRAAADGERSAREEFARRYLPVVEACLSSLGPLRPSESDLADAVGDVLLECLKTQGLLERAERGRGSGFRGLLFAACRNVALRQRTRGVRRREVPATPGRMEALTADEEWTLGRAFDQAWAAELLREAGEHQLRAAQEKGLQAIRRVEILRLRFEEGHDVRRIADLLGLEPAFVHHEYAQARKEFERALRAVVAEHHPDAPDEAARELRELLELFAAPGP